MVVTHQCLGAGTGIFVLEVSGVAGISSSGLEDSTVTIIGDELDSKTPSSGTETEGGTGGVAMKVHGCGWAEVTVTGLDRPVERCP